MQLNPVGYKAAAGAANQLNAEAGATIGVALGYEIILTVALSPLLLPLPSPTALLACFPHQILNSRAAQ